MDKIKLSFLTILIIFLLNFSSVFSLECKLTQGSDCETGWTCVFSLYNYTNSHIAECNLKDDYTVNVCCQESGYNLYVKYRTTDCEANEGGVISYYSSYNSHASEYKLDVDAERNVCLQSTKGTLKCGIVPTANSECLISLWQAKNSHVANCSDVDYKIKIYCGYETPPTYVLTVETLVERYNIPLSDVEVTVPGVGTKKTDESGIAQFDLAPGPSKKISVPVTSNYRNFSHFWDHDCDSTNLNWYLDTDGSPVNSNREFTFEMYKRPRTITAYYKINTEIDDLNYDVTKAVIAGKLFDEGKQGLLERFSSHPTCSGDGVEYRHPNRNVKLYYWDGSWIPISDAYSDLSGDFSKDWKCPLGVWNVQARYYPDLPPDGKNWYYTSSIAEMVVDCRPPDLSKSHSPANPKPGDDVTFKATANDANSGLAEIKIYVNGVLKKTCTYNGETTPQTCSYIEKVSAGTYNYYANATDMAGNWRRMPETGFNMFEITTTTTSTTTSTTSSTTTSSTTTSSTTTSSTTTSSTTTSSTTTTTSSTTTSTSTSTTTSTTTTVKPCYLDILSASPPPDTLLGQTAKAKVEVKNTGGVACYGYVKCVFDDPPPTVGYPVEDLDERCKHFDIGDTKYFYPGMQVNELGTWDVSICRSFNSTLSNCPDDDLKENDEWTNVGTFEVYTTTTSTTTSTTTTTTIPKCSTCKDDGPYPDGVCVISHDIPKENQSSAAQQWYKFMCSSEGPVNIYNSNQAEWHLCYKGNPDDVETCPTTSDPCAPNISDMAVHSGYWYYILVKNKTENPGQGFKIRLECYVGAFPCDKTSDKECCYCDLNEDKNVNILDIAIVAKAFGSKPEDTNWNSTADINNDNVINILDIAKVARVFGCKWEWS